MSRLGESSSASRFMSWRDLVITPLVSGGIWACAAALTWVIHIQWATDWVANVVLLFVLQTVLAILVIRVIVRVYPPVEGVYSFEMHPKETYVFSLLGFLCITHLWHVLAIGLVPPLLRKSVYGLLGGRFGRGIIPISGTVWDPWFVSVEENAVVGQDSLVLGHAMTSTRELVLGRVEIGKGAVIGARSVLMPGVRVGKSAMVNPMSLVSSNTIVRPYEVWGGNPATKLGELTRPSRAPRSEVFIENVMAIAETEPKRLFAKLVYADRDSEEISYGDLIRESARYANLYTSRGLRAKDVLVLTLGHGPELLYGYVGALRAGIIPSILAPMSRKTLREHHLPALAATLESTGAQFVLADATAAGDIEDAMSEQMAILLPSDAKAHASTFEPTHRAMPDDIMLLQHSSGTTGLKKGVALSNRAVIEQLRNYSAAIQLDEDDKIASWLPLYHDMGLVACLLLPLACGVPVVMMSPFEWVADPTMLMTTISSERATLCWLPNFAYNFLATRIDEARLRGVDLRSMRAFINCSEPIRDKSHALFLERFGPCGISKDTLATCYAMAENTFAVTQGGIRERARVVELNGRRFVSSGRPLSKNRVRIVDEGGTDLSEGQVGEIVIQSKSMLTEYYRRPELSAAALSNGWYATGDLGFMMDGHLFVTGRKKDLIICAGKNIDPSEVEDIASSIPNVHPGRVVAFGVDCDEKGTQELVVMVETKVSDDGLRRRIRLELAKAIRERIGVAIDHVEVVPHMSLVKSSSGKIARSANRERYLAGSRGDNDVVLEEACSADFSQN